MLGYAERIGLSIDGLCAHSLRATAATNALDHEADIAKARACEYRHHATL